MQEASRVATAIICASQSILLLIIPASASIPLPNPAELAQISAYEQSVFGKTHPAQQEESRLSTLETSIFGIVHKGSNRSRLKTIAKVMGNRSQLLKLRPLAPIYDQSATVLLSDLPQPSPAPASDYTRQLTDDSSHSSHKAASTSLEQVKSLLRQAISQYQKGNNSDAENLFRQVLQLDAHNSDAHFSLGAIAENKGDLDSASQHYQAALRANPNDVEVQQAITALEGKIHDRTASRQRQQDEQIAQQEALRTQLKQLSAEAAIAYRSGKYNVAVSKLEQVAHQTPGDPDVQYALAQAYRGNGDLDQARRHIGAAIAQDPNNQMYRTVQGSIDQEAASRNNLPPVAPGSSPALASSSGSGSPAGELIPIQPETNPPRRALNYGWASTDGGMRRLAGLIPAVAGIGLSCGLSSHGNGYNNSSSRLTGAGSLAGAATGAAMAAVFNHQRGSIKQGAMRGALLGGIAGLLFSRF